MSVKGSKITFWSNKEIKIAQNFKAKTIISNNLLPGRTPSTIRNMRSKLIAAGKTVYNKKYEPVSSIEKTNSKNPSEKSFKFYKPEEDKIILSNTPDKATKLLPNRKLESVYARRYYLTKIKGFTVDNYITNTPKNAPIKYNKDLNLIINQIEINVQNVKSVFVDKNRIEINTH